MLLPLDAVVSLTQPFAPMDLVPLSTEEISSTTLATQPSKALGDREVELLKMSGYGPVGEYPTHSATMLMKPCPLFMYKFQ